MPVRQHAKEIVDAVADRGGECELVEQVAAELPLLAILDLMGVDLKDGKKFFDWTHTMLFADDPELSISELAGQMAAAEVIGYAMELSEKHKHSPMNNITGALLDAGIGGEPISEEEFGGMFVLILVGGNKSTRTVIAQGMPYLYIQLRSFGIGQHFCIGSHLARMELWVMFEEIIPRLRNPKFAAKPEFVRSYFVNAMKSMPNSFDAEH